MDEYRCSSLVIALLTADEIVGQLFVLSILFQTQTGVKALLPRFDLDFDSKKSKRTRNETKSDPITGEDGTDSITDTWLVDDTLPSTETPPMPELSDMLVKYVNELKCLDMHQIVNRLTKAVPKKHRQIMGKVLQKQFENWNHACTQPLPAGIGDYVVESSPGNHNVQRTGQPSNSHRHKSVKELAFQGSGVSFPKVTILPGRKHLSMAFNHHQLSVCIEVILAFHSFLKYGGSLLADKDSMKEYNKSLCSMLYSLTEGLKRSNGSRQFKLQKFLECSHFLEDHILYGPPSLHNSDTGERGLKCWAKMPAVTAQKRDDRTFLRQVAINLNQRDILDQIEQIRITNADVPVRNLNMARSFTDLSSGKSVTCKGNNFVFVVSCEGGYFAQMDYSKKKYQRVDNVFDPVVINWMKAKFATEDTAVTEDEPPRLVQIHTEITVCNEDGDSLDIIRSHPAYRGSQWHDYVQVNWGEKTGLFPARCALVFSWPAWAIGGEYQPNTPCALVQDVHPDWEKDFGRGKIKNPFTKSILFDHYYLNSTNNVDCIHAKFTLIEVESITRRVFAINPDPVAGSSFRRTRNPAGKNQTRQLRFDIIVAKDRRTEWTHEFLTSYREWRAKGIGK